MSTLNDSLVSSSARRLALRKRPDLSAKQQRYHGQSYWIVKEPVGLRYFRFQEEEYAILQMIDGRLSLDEIKREFEARFPPQKITVEEVQRFVGMLHKSGLVFSDVPGQGVQLKKRHDERGRKELMGKLSNVLAIRFKGFDPERLLIWMYARLWWMFKRWFVMGTLFMALAALVLVLVQFDVFRSKLPTFQQFFSAENAFILAATLGLTKIIHEFGHGLTCKHFGGECHEMGVMLLVLTPCLYCNVSDSWMLPNKWHRAAIGAAGMYVEVVIAGMCTFIWWFTEPGLVHHLCLSTMFVCSVSTIIFNGNPLLRYDGYYILSDVVEIPNLRQKSTSILMRKLAWWCLGLEMPEDPFLPQRKQFFFALYTVAATVYRWFVVISILFFLHKVFEPYGLEVIGNIIATMALFNLVVQPMWKLYKYMSVPGEDEQGEKARVFATVGVVGAVVMFVALVPLPHRVFCTLVIEPRGAKPVYADVNGRLVEVNVEPGQKVTRNQPLAQLVNYEMELGLVELEGRYDRTLIQIEALHQRRFDDPEARALLPQVEESRATLEKQLDEKRRAAAELTLRAPVDGTVLSPPLTPKQSLEQTGTLPTWSGSPLEKRNLNCQLTEGALLCRVGDPTKWEARLIIDQADMAFVVQGQEIDIKLDELSFETFSGTIAEVSTDPLRYAPTNVSGQAGGDLATKSDRAGRQSPVTNSYEARVELDDPEQIFRMGLTGKGKIRAGTRTIGQRLARFLAETFRFKM